MGRMKKASECSECGTGGKIVLGLCIKHYHRFKRASRPKPDRAAMFFGRAIKDEVSGCWNFQRGDRVNGYKRLTVQGKKWLAHRYAWMLANNREPRLWILHSCDNRQCINPAHLREGTPADNSRDLVDRNRQAKGQMMPWAVLNEELVREVKRCLAGGEGSTSIARRLGYKPSTIADVKGGASWAWVTI